MVSHNTRRHFIRAVGTASALGLAGCSGGGGDGGDGGDGGGTPTGDGSDGGGDGGGTTTQEPLTTEFTLSTAPSQTTVHELAIAMSAVVRSNSELTMNAEPSDGTTASVIKMLNGETEMAVANRRVAYQALNDLEPLDRDFPHTLSAVMTNQWLNEAFVVPADRDDLQYHEDLAGEPITWGPTPALGYHYNLETGLGQFIPEDELDINFVGFGEMSSALREGRVSALTLNNILGSLPGYAQQIVSENDLKMLGWREENKQAVLDHEILTGVEFPNDHPVYENIVSFVDSPETFHIQIPYVIATNETLNARTIRTYLTTLWDNRDQLVEAHSLYEAWQDDQHWVDNFSNDVPIHPGAAEFYEEKGLWDDSWQVASL